MTKSDAIDFLTTCSGGELVEVLNQALPRRREVLNRNGLEDHLILCSAWRLADHSSPHNEGWQFSPIADQYPGAYTERESGEPFLQSGQCPGCGVEVDSHAKVAMCPLCGSRVECT